jgi:hypothetical protein
MDPARVQPLDAGDAGALAAVVVLATVGCEWLALSVCFVLVLAIGG